MADLAATLDDPVRLGGGDHNFTTLQHIIDGAAARSTAGSTGYAPGDGLPELREAIAGKLARVNGVTATPGQVCVTTGAFGALFTSLTLAVEPGSDVLLPDPGWSKETTPARSTSSARGRRRHPLCRAGWLGYAANTVTSRAWEASASRSSMSWVRTAPPGSAIAINTASTAEP